MTILMGQTLYKSCQCSKLSSAESLHKVSWSTKLLFSKVLEIPRYAKQKIKVKVKFESASYF